MKAFNLEKALAGEKVITRDGQVVTQIVKFNGLQQDHETIYAVLDDEVRSYYSGGVYDEAENGSRYDLFMAPKKLSGFVNIYESDENLYTVHIDRRTADKMAGSFRVACIDLSQFDEGEGL